MSTDYPTLKREFQRLMSTGALAPDALDGLGPDDASDGDTELAKLAADDEESMYLAMARNLIGREASKLRMGVDCADDDVDREDLAAAKALIDEEADKARRLEEEEHESSADSEPAVSNTADLYAIYAAYEEDDEEDGKDYGPHYRLHPDYQSYPANEPEDENDGDELEPDFLGPRVPSPRRSSEVDERAGPGATTNHGRHVHYDDEDDVIVIKADQCYASSSSSGSGSPSGTNSDRSSSPERFDDQDEQLARDEEKRQKRIAAAKDKPYSPTPDADGIPHFASEDIDMNSVYTLGLQFKSDDEILAGFFGEGHGAVLSNIHPTLPPPPPTSAVQNAPPPAPPAPAPTEHMAIRPELAKRLEEVTRPRNVLHRTMNGDAYIPDGAGGFMSARTGRHVDQAFAGDFLQRQEDNTLRNLAERINAGQVIVTVVDDQPAAPTSPGSDDSNSQDAESVEEQLDAASDDQLDASASDEELVDAPTRQRAREASVETEANDEGDCSPCDEVTQQVPDAPTPPTRKRAREVSVETELNDDDEDDAPLEKRRRVESEEQPGSHAVRSRAPSPSDSNDLGSSTTATQTNLQLNTAAAAAPAAVVKPTRLAANGSDESPTASTSALPAAPPAQEAVPSERRSARIRVITETARVRAAEEARRAAQASPVPKPRGKGKGKGKGKGNGRA